MSPTDETRQESRVTRYGLKARGSEVSVLSEIWKICFEIGHSLLLFVVSFACSLRLRCRMANTHAYTHAHTHTHTHTNAKGERERERERNPDRQTKTSV